MERLAVCFVYTGSQYFVYDYSQPVTPGITQDTRPRMVDALLTLLLPLVYPQYAIM
jgi:hypothetical protein